jgi:hypothetical protein
MKYLSTYNKYNESIDIVNRQCAIDHGDVIDVIKDRLADLDDDGFDISVMCSEHVDPLSKNPSTKQIRVRIEKSTTISGLDMQTTKSHYFSIKEVLNDIDSLTSHINNEYNLSIDVCYRTRYLSISKSFGESYINALKNMGDARVFGIELIFHQRKIPKSF